jgi:CRP/FNR family cyclic AMP-dependent transcriptional regulator
MTDIPILRHETDIRTFAAGQTIFKAGDPGDLMYAVIEGEVDIYVHDRLVEALKEGGIFGELALIDTSPRSASAIAKTDCKVAAVTQARFIKLIQSTPFFAIQVMHVMADRIRRWGEVTT